MRKKLLMIIILGGILTLSGLFYALVQTGKIIPQAAENAATLYLNPATGTFDVGQTFTVNVMVDTAGNLIDGVEVHFLNYEPTKLEVQDANPNIDGVQVSQGEIPQIDVYAYNSVDTANGQIAVVGAVMNDPNGWAGSGIFAKVTFKVLATADSSLLTFDALEGVTTDCNISEHASDPPKDILGAVGEGSYVLKTPTPPPAADPTVDLKANSKDGPITISYNSAAKLSWSSKNASSCSASGDWSGTKNTSGSQSTGNLTSSKRYTLTCSGNGKNVSDAVRVNVSAPVVIPPTPPAPPGEVTPPSDQPSETPSDTTQPTEGTTTPSTPTTPTPIKTPTTSPRPIARIPSYSLPTTTSSTGQVKSSSKHPWAYWFFFVCIPAFLTTGAVWLFLRRKKEPEEEEEEDLL